MSPSQLLSKHNEPILSDRSTLLGLPLDRLNRRDALQRASALLIRSQTSHIVTLNALMILASESDPALRKACQEADLVVADSSGVSVASRILGLNGVERFPGIDLADELCRICAEHNHPVYLLGGDKGIAEQAAQALARRHPKILVSGARDGFFKESDEAAILNDIAASHARLVLVGIGMPKQELWIHRLKNHLPAAVYIGVGGSLDVWAGRVKRAPNFVQKLGLEWLFRLQQEPFRWRRMAQLPKFALKVASERLKGGRGYSASGGQEGRP